MNSQEAQELLGSSSHCKNQYSHQDHIKPTPSKSNSLFTVLEQLFEWQKDEEDEAFEPAQLSH